MQIQLKEIEELENRMKGKYLTEEWLGEFLKVLYPNKEWIHDQKFKTEETTYNFRPDYCCHELKLCVEFDGPDHFTKASVIQADIKKDKILHELGYKVIRIPYFIQLDFFSIQHFFGEELFFSNKFPHGFISRNVTLPANFCEQGIWKFKKLLSTLDTYKETGHIFDEIQESLMTKVNKLSERSPRERAGLNVVPSSLLSCLRFRNLNTFTSKKYASSESKLPYIILESSQIVRDRARITDLNFIYTSEGDVSGYFFNLINDMDIDSYNIFIENNAITVNIYKGDKLLTSQEKELTNMNIQEIVNFIFPNDN